MTTRETPPLGARLKPYTCPQCGKPLQTEHGLSLHMRSVHPDPLVFPAGRVLVGSGVVITDTTGDYVFLLQRAAGEHLFPGLWECQNWALQRTQCSPRKIYILGLNSLEY